MAQEPARQADVEPGLAHQHGSPDRVGAVEAGDLLRGRCGRRRDLEAARIGIDFEACELAVEGVEVGRCGAIVLLGLGLVAERLMGAAEPVLAARVAQRPVGGLGQRLEMAERQLGILEVAQRQPSREERRILGGIDGERAGIAHQVVGHLGLAEPERRIGVGAPLLPPAVRLDGSGRLRLRQQDLPGLLLFLLAAQGLRLLHGEAPVGLRVRAAAWPGASASSWRAGRRQDALPLSSSRPPTAARSRGG